MIHGICRVKYISVARRGKKKTSLWTGEFSFVYVDMKHYKFVRNIGLGDESSNSWLQKGRKFWRKISFRDIYESGKYKNHVRKETSNNFYGEAKATRRRKQIMMHERQSEIVSVELKSLRDSASNQISHVDVFLLHFGYDVSTYSDA